MINITLIKCSTPWTRLGILVLVVLVLAGCAQTPTKTPSLPKVLEAIDDIAAENGDRIVVVRDYVDEVKIDGKDVRQRYQYAWNYTRAIAQLRIFSLDGALLSVEDQPLLTLNASESEQAYAFSVVKADPRWKSLHNPDSTFYGGFSFRPPQHPVCSPHARCIHVFASDSGGYNTTLHVIFDLASGYSEVFAALSNPP
jgi:hypothetical protein